MYFGVDASRFMKPSQVLEKRRIQREEAENRAKQRAEKMKALDAKQRGKDPMSVVMRDLAVLEKQKSGWKEHRETAQMQLDYIDGVEKKAEAAKEFIQKASPELREKLRFKEEWQKHEELKYIYDMKGMF